MLIFQHSMLFVVFSLLVCPIASQTGQKVKKVNSGHCTSAERITTAADCQAAGQVLGLEGTVYTISRSGYPPGCSWEYYGSLHFNTKQTSRTACYDGPTVPICLCEETCPIGTYQNEESSTTCKSCLPGTYSDETGEATCKNCPAGKDSATGASNCTICCHSKANYSKYEKNCNMIKDETACYLMQFDPSVYTCDWNCNSMTVVNMHNVSQK